MTNNSSVEPEVEVENEEPVNHVADTIDNMYTGELDAMRDSFNNAMAGKIADALVDRRLELSSTMFQPADPVKEDVAHHTGDETAQDNKEKEKLTKAGYVKGSKMRATAYNKSKKAFPGA
jgi:hypothetical protein